MYFLASPGQAMPDEVKLYSWEVAEDGGFRSVRLENVSRGV